MEELTMKSYIKDYPRPQMVRPEWENLNGPWLFAFDDNNSGEQNQWSQGIPNDTTITVPYTYETKLSGIEKTERHDYVWYQRSIKVTKPMLTQRRVMLHFEGSDYITKVWINGQFVGKHQGGYARFSFDITHAVHKGENILVVKVEDSYNVCQPRGKQRWKGYNYGCWYIQTTGIWKTVWLESVPQEHIKRVKITPHLKQKEVVLECNIEKGTDPVMLEARVEFAGVLVNTSRITVCENYATMHITVLSLDVSEWGVKAWSPNDPNLYDVHMCLIKNDKIIDEIGSYFGMREIRIEHSNILLNGVPLYQRLLLDQGYWQDSHLTPPNEQALIEDIEKVLELGYNGVRKHQKIEDERFLYWCDIKGLLVWSEFPATYHFTDYAVECITTEWMEIIQQNYNHPSIITWTPFNESWGVQDIKIDSTQQKFTEAIYYLTKSFDPYRPVIVNDGWEHTISDIITLHDYEEFGDAFFKRYNEYKQEILENRMYHSRHKSAFANGYSYKGQPVLMTEYGGIAFDNDEKGWGYGNKVTTEEDFITRFEEITNAIKKTPYICGFCYTQLSDVQQEMNGLMDIKRSFKVNPKRISEINKRQVGHWRTDNF